ncbi:MAG: rRNA maturation RNase YbeY [Mycoplasmoidaceae bacterium]|nr:rRNA maturation RNase YbeY [Mycoplasmoidaceae bacterium]
MVRYRLYGSLPVTGVKNAFNSICESTFKELKLCENVVFDVNIVTPAQIKNINNKYRKTNKVTDVISFANRDNSKVLVPLLGEIFICLDQAKKQAHEYKHSLQRELIFLFTHGLLHLLGFDHQTSKQEKEMMSLSKKIINKAQINPKYIIK